MPFKYCTDCGYKNVYTTRQAKFCAGCGESLIGEKSPAPQIAQANSSQGDISSENKGIPNIQKLEMKSLKDLKGKEQKQSPVNLYPLKKLRRNLCKNVLAQETVQQINGKT